MPRDVGSEEFHVEVKHHSPLPDRYTWQIHRAGQVLPITESKGEYGLLGRGEPGRPKGARGVASL